MFKASKKQWLALRTGQPLFVQSSLVILSKAKNLRLLLADETRTRANRPSSRKLKRNVVVCNLCAIIIRRRTLIE